MKNLIFINFSNADAHKLNARKGGYNYTSTKKLQGLFTYKFREQ